MLVELRSLESIKPYDQNPRRNDAAVDAVIRSIEEFGWRQPIVIDKDDVFVVGHTRWKAAKKMGLAQVPVHVADLPPEKARAYRIADNATAAIATWDDDLLPAELRGLASLDIDIKALGFSAEELAQWLPQDPAAGLVDPDAIPEPPAEATTQPGDLWLLGDHRLLCGDSANAAHVDALLDGAPIHLLNTDPPYNVKVEPRSNNAIAAGLSSFGTTHHQSLDLARHPEKGKATHERLRAKDRPLQNDFVSDEAFNAMLAAWFGNAARVLVPGRAFYVWGGYSNIGAFPGALATAGLYHSQCVIWNKEWPVLTRKDFMGAHEWCFYGWREGAAHRFFGPANVPDLWSIRKVTPTAMTHLTEKPVELAARAMQYSSQPGENVLDLFGGSGSTLIAAEQLGRRAYLMEIDPLYCDVILTRWAQFVNKEPVLQRTGETFSSLKGAGRA